MTQTNQTKPLWNIDAIQFPRLLAEIMATQPTLDIPSLAESMDLTIAEVNELFDRANDAWEAAKAGMPPAGSVSVQQPDASMTSTKTSLFNMARLLGPDSASDPQGKMLVSLDGGQTFAPVNDDVRVIYPRMWIEGEDEPGELHINLSSDSIISDVWVSRDEHLDHNIGTDSVMPSDVVSAMVADND